MLGVVPIHTFEHYAISCNISSSLLDDSYISCQLFCSMQERRRSVPLISFGGITTPAGALISSRTAKASPLVAEGAMSALMLRLGCPPNKAHDFGCEIQDSAPLRSAESHQNSPPHQWRVLRGSYLIAIVLKDATIEDSVSFAETPQSDQSYAMLIIKHQNKDAVPVGLKAPMEFIPVAREWLRCGLLCRAIATVFSSKKLCGLMNEGSLLNPFK
jgi:hypothetical protein